MREGLRFALLYVVLSVGLEAALMLLLGWKVPQDNARIAPVILTVPPVVTAWILGYRGWKRFAVVVSLCIVLTLVITGVVTRLTGVSTGLAEPLVNRSLAGFLTALAVSRSRLARRVESAPGKLE
jgi:glucose-6-phosphate-specific signal transduction histidine kinase